ncbi:unnamed protein product [Symbiodinium necroappetens]|uniref:RAP domain-containing protein n=1 Tax=Symbiodinium necroappetens TaxID=1628268 RepID=A0A813AUN4_9DINO|nr:unnamed protein product [Symbiodinium necroappetens]
MLRIAVVLRPSIMRRFGGCMLICRRQLQSSAGQLTAKLRHCHKASDVIGLVSTALGSERMDGVLWAAAVQRLSLLEMRGKPSRESWAWLLGMADSSLQDLGYRELAVVAVAISKLKKDPGGRKHFLNAVFRNALLLNARDQSMSVRHLANLAWSAAAAKVQARRLFEVAAAAQSQEQSRCLNPRDVSQLLWAFARSSHFQLGVEVLENLARCHASPHMLPTFGDHDIAATVWAGATLATHLMPREKGRLFLKQIAAHAAERSSEFSPQGFSMLFWGTATLASKGLDMPSTALTAACAPHVVSVARRLTTQGAANILWSLSTLAKIDPDVAAKIVEEIRDVGSVSSSSTNDGQGRQENPGIIEALLEEIVRKLSSCNGQDIANSLWAVANIGYLGPSAVSLFNRIAEDPDAIPVHLFSAQECANSLWAIARSRWSGDPQKFVRRVCARIESFARLDEQSLSITVWALAVLGHRHSALPLLGNSGLNLKNLNSFPNASLCLLIWTCGMLGIRESPFPALVVALRCRARELTPSQLSVVARTLAGLWPRFADLKIKIECCFTTLCLLF